MIEANTGASTTGAAETAPLKDVAYQYIREAILAGRFRPGAPLPVNALADELDMSRTPVREALRALQAEGLVEVYPSRGTFVSSLSLDDIRDLFEVREALEGLAAGLAARRRSEADLTRLDDLMQEAAKQVQAADVAAVQAAGAEFHRELARIAGNTRLSSIRADVELHLDRARLASYTTAGRGREALGEHRQILDAIRRGDGGAAERAMREHLRVSEEYALRRR